MRKGLKNLVRNILLLFLFSGLIFVQHGVAETIVDNSIYAHLLEKYVKNGVVDYQGFKGEEKKLDEYLKILGKTDFTKLPRNEQYAYYVNAYNAWTVKLILTGYPGITSIKELGTFWKSPWKKKICRIGGKKISLDDIEHRILRPRFKDPRIHFVVNCASKSCPPLRSEPYSGKILDQQLDDATRSFLNDPTQNYLQGKTLYVSSLFKWYKGDFKDGVISFFLKYAEGDLKKKLLVNKDKITVKYLHYDWSLNGK